MQGEERDRRFRFRVIFVGLILGLLNGVIIARAFDLMIIQGPKLREIAKKQHYRVEKLSPRRGPIVDRNGAVLAESVPVDSVYAHPHKITDPAAAAKILGQILQEKEEYILEKLASNGSFVWIKRAIAADQADAVRRAKIDGIVVVGEYARYYPQGSLASQLIGFVGAYGEGLEGLEKKYNDILAGSEESYTVKRDALGKSLYRDAESIREPMGSNKLVLTIDTRIQSIVDAALDKAFTSSGAENAMAAVMEVNTGKILAMAMRPTFDPNRYKNFSKDTYRNKFITDPFEPGSTFKVFTLSALLDSGKGKITDELFCEEGAYEIDGYIINDTHSYGWFTVEEIIVHSSNIGAGKIGLKLGRDILGQYVSNFGFGAQTGIDLPAESGGIVGNFKRISHVGIANIAFGQGIGVTGIQLITALNVLASGGKLFVPRVVDRVEDKKGNAATPYQPKVLRTIIKPESLESIRQVLINVVHGGGTGKRAAPNGYTVAGKTGTAQKANRDSGGYYDDRFVASFMGWAPAQKPEITILVVVDDPKGEPWGGSVAAPAFREIAEKSLPLLGIMPEFTAPADNIAASSTQAAGVNLAQAAVPNSAPVLQPTVYFWDNKIAVPDDRMPCTNCMPDLTGLSLRQTLVMANKYGFAVTVFGSGRVIGQMPQPGAPLDGLDKWRVELVTGPN